ncbi:1-deoxy-D-xylulose-5-phosphate reductoisomerase [Clostridium luticellarii]|jgi:1-deoxy-D-xylulose-5-phosphate reductoisomerase|uniref:1-deoxy-D-xylulose 5-phosphate reductoisomerase n=1 Tax=Clostridium luticellarii TaxID=1691940 RepID=A0A2T0BR80_9CLOT|nr:1-deoxy-D-xylulose-5-phosphate reductoisomerase [Clostridium luticellarii]MCI1943907.1 1-deoxy-D-xylulose-5-phosphate reductoisomerase [Clostridium luticellarii]MCI1967168.1 1-deoxy-D-xylulose-5-phosphate reductoisomerase [Clostridium luticellarii]MCI1994535.1 1-deoxy-D-xylulose-5-phosphate reductoisomerase [Clostridium luticellarii]MCI2038512.1 1-deoxy-D-xylulose-5-phosphate reductoisomerase [Clostridium luticellarii]PRR86387.1 1-deoxy-D-xylulose 5-phosphate reductoisomerase [Clostridium l
MRKISILGATGSIGTQALDVLRKDRENFQLVGVSANSNSEKLLKIVEEFKPSYAVLTEREAYLKFKGYFKNKNRNFKILFGTEGLNIIASLPEIDMTVTSVMGMSGLVPTIKAIEAGKDIALANKETLVVGGKLVTKLAEENNVKLIPVDSEHSAIFQCLRGNKHSDAERLLVTASGGPFRGKSKEELLNVTVQQALKHPSWHMGEKITIDSATLMNKGLEVIEAHWLFDLPYEKIKVVVHPESIVHSMVEYKDGSVIAQLASTDMRLPIQYALNYPKRGKAVVDRLDFYSLKKLTFEKPDMNTFRSLKLAYEAGKIGGTMPAILNCANEEAVQLFLSNKIKFLDISNIVEECMNKFSPKDNFELKDLLYIEIKIKEYVKTKFGK